MIDWKEGVVCFAGGWQFLAPKRGFYNAIGGGFVTDGYFDRTDFQINEIREGDYIEASELDTEQKYNDAVAVFGLFGAKWGLESCTELSDLDEGDILIWSSTLNQGASWHVQRKRKITYQQLMAIGKLKRVMIERDAEKQFAETGTIHGYLLRKHTMTDRDETKGDLCSMFLNLKSAVDNGDYEGVGDISKGIMMSGMEVFKANSTKPKESKHNKSKQAYAILKALDYEYDLVKQRWYKKAYI